jgi:hypothetical protein
MLASSTEEALGSQLMSVMLVDGSRWKQSYLRDSMLAENSAASSDIPRSKQHCQAANEQKFDKYEFATSK